MKKYLFGSLLTLLIIAVFSLVFMFSGSYNLSATIPHMKATETAIVMMKEKSIKVNSEDIEVPDLSDENLILSGFKGYDAMCVTCHAAPGKSASVIADGLYPKPPELGNREIIEEWNDKELFWIIKNGIKLTGMPAYGPTHSDEDLWSIVAFLNHLPEISEKDYKAMGRKTKGNRDDSHHNNGGDQQDDVHIHKDGKKHVH
ncbi:MAG: c-type cytochrome [Candidatus Dadabacteria bacterium]|nr:c-type cytochrome [Candidatus Dadabacteria bacterium]